MILRLLIASILGLGLALTAPASANQFSQVVVFGDSLSDDGDGLPVGPPPPYADGRFSNGPVWAEVYADIIGATLDSRAIGGSLSGPSAYTGASNSNGPFDDVTSQVNNYIAEAGNVPADPNALYVLFSGANDFLDLNGFAGAMGRAPTEQEVLDTINNALINIVGQVTTLAGIGAKNIAVANLPDLGKTPLGNAAGGETQAGLSAISTNFNSIFATALDISDDLPADVGYFLLDVTQFQNSVIDQPLLFGFENVTEKCFDADAPSLCPDPDVYAFWDDIHPTAAGHAALADEFFDQIAETLNPTPTVLGINPPGSGTGGLGPFAIIALILLRLRRR